MTKVKIRVTKTNSIFIMIVIVAGIFIAIFSLFIIEVEAQPPIPVGKDPEGIAYDPGNKRIYVTNNADNTVSVIDTTTNKVIDTKPNTPEIDPIMVRVGPEDIVYDPVNKRMYVGNHNDKSVSVIDTTTNTVLDTNPNTPEIDPIMVGDGPEGIAYDPMNKRMYVTNIRDGTVSVIDTTTNTVTSNPITVGDRPIDIAYDPVSKRMYVTNIGPDTVSLIDTVTNTVIESVKVGDGPSGIAYMIQ